MRELIILVNNTSLDFSQQVLDLVLTHHLEALAQLALLDDSDFDVLVSHLPLESVLESFDRGVHCIANINVVCVGLLKEGASLFRALAECGSLPTVVGSGGFNLEDLRSSCLVPSADNHADTEWSDATRLSVLLEELGVVLAHHEGSDLVHVLLVVHLDVLARFGEHSGEVGSDSGVGDSHVVA